MAGKTVTRADLADAIYQLQLVNRNADPAEPISREASAELVEAVLQSVSDALVAGQSVKISSFGAFEVREKAARVGRNPKTGEEAPITPRRVLSFRASHVLKDRLNLGDAAAAEPRSDPSAEAAGDPPAPGGAKTKAHADDDAF